MFILLYKIAHTVVGDPWAEWLRELAIHLAPVFTSLFNQSLSSEILPSDWKTANVTPVFKKGNRSLASNYHPISLVCVACKLLEHCIVSHVMQHFDQHNILTPLQHGFRKKHSCESQFALTIHDRRWKYVRWLELQLCMCTMSYLGYFTYDIDSV